MSKRSCLRTPFGSECVKGFQTLLNDLGTTINLFSHQFEVNGVGQSLL